MTYALPQSQPLFLEVTQSEQFVRLILCVIIIINSEPAPQSSVDTDIFHARTNSSEVLLYQ